MLGIRRYLSQPYQNSLHAVKERDPRHEPIRSDDDDAEIITEQRIRLLFGLTTQRPNQGASPFRPQPGVVNAFSGSQERSSLVVLFRILDHEVLGVIHELNGSVSAPVRRQGDHRFGT